MRPAVLAQWLGKELAAKMGSIRWSGFGCLKRLRLHQKSACEMRHDQGQRSVRLIEGLAIFSQGQPLRLIAEVWLDLAI